MAVGLVLVLALALATAQSQYYPALPSQQQQGYYYPPQPQQQHRAGYGRAINQNPPTNPYYGQQGQQDYAPLTVGLGQSRPETLQGPPPSGYPNPPPPPYYGYPSGNPFSPENIFRAQQNLAEQQRYLTPPSLKFKIGLVTDNHKVGNRDEDTGLFKAWLREGFLYIQNNKENPGSPNITLEFSDEKPHELQSGINYGGKGFALSTLNVFNGKIYTCDDATGVLYELKKVEEEDDETNKEINAEFGADRVPNSSDDQDPDAEKKYHYVAQPWLILANEGLNKGFKCEWGVVRDNRLWLGSSGDLVRNDTKNPEQSELTKERQFVKVVDPTGEVTTLDWTKNYDKISEAYDVNLRQGHVVHEAAAWSDILQKWVFIPRRVTKEQKDKQTWNKVSTNVGVLSDDSFSNIKTQKFGNLTEDRGITGLRFIPGTQDQFFLALKAGQDEEGHHFSTLSVLDTQGNEVLPEISVGDDLNYAAVEFL